MTDDKNTAAAPARTVPTVGQALGGNALILIATTFWGINIPAVKVLIPDWMTANDVTVFRLVGAAILFWAVSLFVKPQRIERRDLLRILLGSGVGLFLFIYLFNTALKYGNAIDVSIIMTLPPVFVIIMGVLFRKSRPGWMEIAGILIAFAGAAIVITGHQGATHHAPDPLLGNLLAVASGLCYATYLFVLEGPTHKYRPIPLLRWVFLAAAVPALSLSGHLFDAPIFTHPGWQGWGWAAFVVCGATFVAYLLVNPAIRLIGSEMVSLYQYLLPVIATIGAVIMGLDRLHIMQVVAMVVIIGGMVLTNVGGRRRRRKAALTAQPSGTAARQ